MLRTLLLFLIGCMNVSHAGNYATPYAKMLEGTLSIYAQVAPGRMALVGSAWAYKERDAKKIVTAAHVLISSPFFSTGVMACASSVPVSEESCVVLDIEDAVSPLGRGAELDWAMWSVDDLPKGVRPLRIARKPISVGEGVIVIGSPMGEVGVVTTGIVSQWFVQELLFETTARIKPGNSGCVVLDRRGRVVGMMIAAQIVNGQPAWSNSVAIPVEAIVR